MTQSICKWVKLELVSNQRRDPSKLQDAYNEVKSLYPWMSERGLADLAKELYARQNNQ